MEGGSGAGNVPHVNGFDVITVNGAPLPNALMSIRLRRQSDLLFIKDAALRESIRQDVGAANRALKQCRMEGCHRVGRGRYRSSLALASKGTIARRGYD